MKNFNRIPVILLYLCASLLSFFTSNNLTAQQVVKVGAGEYLTVYLMSDKTVKVSNQSTITPVLSTYSGLDSIIDVQGGQYHVTALDQQGKVYKLGNTAGYVMTTVDEFGSAFTANFQVKGFWQCNVSLRGTDSSLWYWGIADPMNYNAGATITAPKKLLMPSGKKFKKVETGAFSSLSSSYILALATDGSVWRYDRNNPTPYQINLSGQTVIDICTLGGAAQVLLTATNKLFAAGVLSTYAGTASNTTTYTDVTAAWTSKGMTFPIKELVGNSSTLHIIDANNNMFGSGTNVQGEVGTGVEYSPYRIAGPQGGVFGYGFTNGVLLTPPTQIQGKFKNLNTSTTITFYLYVQDMGNNWYSWGRNKGFSLGNGKSAGPYAGWGGAGDYASYPNAMDVPMPKRVNLTTLTWVLQSFDPNATIPPVVGAGINQYLSSVSSTTLYGKAFQQEQTIASNTWTKVSGPAGGTITNPGSLNTTITGLSNGTYVYRLSATNSNGQTSTDDVSIIVSSVATPTNIIPTVNAGTDKIITLPISTTTLNGTAGDADGTISSYFWTKISGPTGGTITSNTTASTAIAALQAGIYTFSLTVTDNAGATAKDTVQVTASAALNIAPNAIAGSDATITLPVNGATLSGSGTDSDGTITAYQWVRISGPTSGALTNASAANTTATGLVQGIYSYQLTVTDNAGATAKDTMQVTVNAALNISPNAIAGADATITLPVNSATLSGSGTDSDGTITTYQWVKISGPASAAITNATAANTTVTGLVQGIYSYQLTVTDNAGATAKDTVQVTINAALNIAPTAISGANATLTLPVNSAALSGSGTDSDGTIIIYQWVKISGPASGAITNAASANTTVTGLVQGIYSYQLTVTDNAGATGRDTVNVIVNAAINMAPIVNAGLDANITLPTNSSPLRGSATDADGTIASYAWVKISGPAAGTLTNAATANATAAGLVQGVYSYQLTVTDNAGAMGRDTVNVNVNTATVTLLPAVNPANTVNGLEYKYYQGTWSVLPSFSSLTPVKKGNTSNFNISLATRTSKFGFSFTGFINVPSDGQYKFYTTSDDGSKLFIDNVLTVANDGSHTAIEKSGLIGLKAGKHIITGLYFQLSGGKVFTVSYEGPGVIKQTIPSSSLFRVNVLPVSNAGSNQILSLPTNSTTLMGVGTDADGTVSAYQWKKVSGPTQGNIVTVTNASTVINNLAQGIYTFELTVTDNDGGIQKDSVLITINPSAIAIAPVANAGTDNMIQLPANRYLLDGRSSTDADGTISSYQWSLVSGPSGSTLLTATKDTCSVSFTNSGTYILKLTVTDNNGLSATDNVQVIVEPALLISKALKVNIDNGTAPYVSPQWNNWIPVANINSINFKYEDGTQSSIFVNMPQGGSFSDNGANYGATVTNCPPAVLRITSMHTITRIFTVNGLNPNKQYGFEFYGSRAFTSGSKSVFKTGNVADTINTDFNESDFAKFNNISPDNTGKIEFTLSIIGSYHYLSAFTITEQADVPVAFAPTAPTPTLAKQVYQGENIVEMGADAVSVYPNPFAGSFKVQLNNKTAGTFVLKLSATSGQTVFYKKINKASGTVIETINVSNLTPGTYILEIISVATGNKTVHKVIKN